jgi:hypothetical protein
MWFYKKKISLIKIHSVMQNQIVSTLKSVAIVVAGVLVANYIQVQFLSAKVTPPVATA